MTPGRVDILEYRSEAINHDASETAQKERLAIILEESSCELLYSSVQFSTPIQHYNFLWT